MFFLFLLRALYFRRLFRLYCYEAGFILNPATRPQVPEDFWPAPLQKKPETRKALAYFFTFSISDTRGLSRRFLKIQVCRLPQQIVCNACNRIPLSPASHLQAGA